MLLHNEICAVNAKWLDHDTHLSLPNTLVFVFFFMTATWASEILEILLLLAFKEEANKYYIKVVLILANELLWGLWMNGEGRTRTFAWLGATTN